jgi:tetraacyldisaccharide 4'-kinase
VPLDEPGWWYGARSRPRLLAPLLTPLGRLYGWLAQTRYHRSKPYRSRLPVICAGNFTAGGTGKTPLSIFIARLLQERGGKPAFLTRGYGGREQGPAWVEEGAPERFGDEALLLSRIAPTLVARDRADGARTIEAAGDAFTAIIMDDGLQNPSLAKNLSFAVVDGERGLGNGEVIPAGPLRAPMEFQLGLVDAIIVREPETSSASDSGVRELLRRRFPGPVLTTGTRANGDVAWLAQKPLVAFAGIANPGRFFSLLEHLGGRLAGRVVYRDHHAFTAAEAESLIALAAANGAELVTTEKDWVRLAGRGGALAELKQRARALPVALEFDERDLKRLHSLIDAALSSRDGTLSSRNAKT